MEGLQDFRDKDMIEQITLLEELKEGGRTEAIPQLLDLIATPLGDQAVDEMIYHALYGLLAGQEQQLVQGLRHPAAAVRLLCVRRAAEEGGEALKQPLLDLLEETTDSELLSEVIRALADYRDAALVARLLPFLDHSEYPVVAWAMRVLVASSDLRVRDALVELINASEELAGKATGCDLRTALAVENLAHFPDQSTIDFLISHIHHPNPSFRRMVLSTLASMGEEVLPALEQCLEQGSRDEKIMAANTIGLMGKRPGADILVAQLEKAEEPNLRFAIYEALGRIPSMRSVIGLTDGLKETDELVLLAVVTGLDHQCNPGVVKVVNELLAKADQQSARILRALVTARAVNLFRALYNEGSQASALVEAVFASGDPEAAKVFQEALSEIDSARAKADAQRLAAAGKAAPSSQRRLLAADDSKAMLFFYKGVAADLGMELVAVEDGKQAYEQLQEDSDFDLVITDMNMPNMDGIELTREIRKHDQLAALPVLMATTESEASQSELASQAGVTDFITKPFSKEDFKLKLAKLLR